MKNRTFPHICADINSDLKNRVCILFIISDKDFGVLCSLIVNHKKLV